MHGVLTYVRKRRAVVVMTIVVGRAMTQAVGCLPPTAEAWVHFRVSHVRFVVDKLQLGQGFLRVRRFYPVNIIPPWLSVLVSSGRWTIGPLVTAVHMISPYRHEQCSCEQALHQKVRISFVPLYTHRLCLYLYSSFQSHFMHELCTFTVMLC
jgi:hypothetical protein